MNSVLFYTAMSRFYDLLDVIYFRKYDTSPRKVVNEAIKDGDKILDLCTGTGTNAVNIAKNLYSYFGRFGLTVVDETHCDYSKVLRLKKSDQIQCPVFAGNEGFEDA